MSAFELELQASQRALQTQSRRISMGNADRKPPVLRPGAMDALQLPSRMGSRLVWRDGRVEPAQELQP